jgi:hypothetical protein
MAAGLGFKDFATGEVLTAADVDGYLMQGIWVFASNAARDAAVTAPAEGNFAFTKDTNSLWYYDGAAWVASGATGDIEGVTAGVGISGGGTSGTVTITNDMATTITASGDIVVGTGSGTYDNLPIGTTNQVLTADTTVSPYKVKWATPVAGTFAGVRAIKSTNQAIPNNTSTVVTFDGTDTFDTDAFHSTVTNTGRLTVPVGKAGYYQIYYCMQWDVNATGDRDISLYYNGTATGIAADIVKGSATEYYFVNSGTTYYLAEGDYVQLVAYQNSGGNLNVTNTSRGAFGMNKVG